MSTSSAPPVVTTTNLKTTAPTVDPTQSFLSETFSNVINGKVVTSQSTYDVINPATRQVIGRAPEATREQLDQAVNAARMALPSWKAKPWGERVEVLRRMANLFEDKQFAENLAKMLTLEMGKPLTVAKQEVQICSLWIRGSLDLSLDKPTLILENEETKIFSRYVPMGVCAGIVPWNFPLSTLIWKVVPALLTGNTLILKPSPYAPLATLTFVARAQELLPPGVLSILSGGDELGKQITAHPDIDKVSLTGSIPTGKKVLMSSVDTLKRVTLELGGNDACIVLSDADPAKVAPKLATASFINSGQVCTATKRIYVHESIYDQFMAKFVEAARDMKVGDPLEPSTVVGPLCNAHQYDIIRGFINDCKKNGYKFALGGEVDFYSPGYFLPLTIIDNPPDDSRIVKEEPFGPIVPVLKWSNHEEVIRRANDSQCGLGASVWGKDAMILELMGGRLEVGNIWINDANQFHPLKPFGGHKQSGIGFEHGIEGLKHWCNLQTVSVNKVADV